MTKAVKTTVSRKDKKTSTVHEIKKEKNATAASRKSNTTVKPKTVPTTAALSSSTIAEEITKARKTNVSDETPDTARTKDNDDYDEDYYEEK